MSIEAAAAGHATTMRAWVVRAPGPIDTNPMSYTRKPVPRPERDELLVKVSISDWLRSSTRSTDAPPRGHRPSGPIPGAAIADPLSMATLQ
jgi:propanol-preferring alcohol dehydrogenase